VIIILLFFCFIIACMQPAWRVSHAGGLLTTVGKELYWSQRALY
jgi:hypothetical protein